MWDTIEQAEKQRVDSGEPKIKAADGNTFIPDIITIRNRKAIDINPTIVYENSDNSLQRCNHAKVQKYLPLKDEIRHLYGVDEVEFHGLATGARRGWCS